MSRHLAQILVIPQLIWGSSPTLREESSQQQLAQASQNHAETKEKMMEMYTSQGESSHLDFSLLLICQA